MGSRNPSHGMTRGVRSRSYHTRSKGLPPVLHVSVRGRCGPTQSVSRVTRSRSQTRPHHGLPDTVLSTSNTPPRTLRTHVVPSSSTPTPALSPTPTPTPSEAPAALITLQTGSLRLAHLPSDVLEYIFSLLPSEIPLLGGVARVNTEFREIAFRKGIRECVQKNFRREHVKVCNRCFRWGNLQGSSSPQPVSAADVDSLPCVIHLALISRDSLLSLTDPSGATVLHLASSRGQLAIVRYLVEVQSAPEAAPTAGWGRTVLHYAASNPQSSAVDVLRYFVQERGAAALLRQTDNFRSTVLHTAARVGNVGVLRYIVGLSGTPKQMHGDSMVSTNKPTHCQRDSNKGAAGVDPALPVADLLYETNHFQETVLHAAADHGQLQVVKYLLGETSGGRRLVGMRASNGRNVLHYASNRGHLDIIRYVIEVAGAKDLISKADDLGETVLHLAATWGHVAILRYFLEERRAAGLLHTATVAGRSVLQAATDLGRLAVIRYLVEDAAQTSLLEATDCRGETVLHSAARAGYVDVVRYILVERGCSHLARKQNNEGHTPLDFARCRQVATLLRSAMRRKQ